MKTLLLLAVLAQAQLPDDTNHHDICHDLREACLHNDGTFSQTQQTNVCRAYRRVCRDPEMR